MSLEKYKQKRKFEKTPEPTGGKSDEPALTFVVQKHAASHLHYDFRLEMRGVLKSWAVPKGPSLNPNDRRLAMMVEDHPYDYKNFEGIIPKGNYGAGAVIIWDEGTYELTSAIGKSKKQQEKELLSNFYKGSLKLRLYGKKLQGDFALVKAPEKEQDNAWFLIKIKDEYASAVDVTKQDKSIKSGLTVEQMAAKKNAAQWQSNRNPNGSLKEEKEEETAVAVLDEALLKSGRKSAFPARPQPMLATLVKDVMNDDEWLYEVKWDGYRILGTKKNKKVSLLTRSGLDYSRYYPVLVDELAALPVDVVLDGEVVVLDKEGKPDFDALQAYKGEEHLAYYVFDLLWVDGYDVTGLTLVERKELLQQLLPASDVLKYSDHFDDGESLLAQVKQLGLEGIVAKKRDSIYQPAKRSKHWLKLPTHVRQEFVIGGWTESDSGRLFRSLLFGHYDNGQLHFVGHAGGGFKEAEMPELFQQLKKLEIRKKPFVNDVDHSTTPHWVKPQLVAVIKYATFTKGGKIRKPATFLGLRTDKPATEVVKEEPLSIKEERKVVKTSPVKKDVEVQVDSNWSLIKEQKITSQSEVLIDELPVLLTNVEHKLWKDVTKAQLIEYYHHVAPYILPHVKDRPQSLHIKLHGATRPGFYIKDMENNQPGWAEIFSIERKHKKKDRRDIIDYLVCQNEATLLYMINLGCIDVNPWTATIHDHLHPDYIIIDLDPSDDDFSKAIEAALAAKDYLQKQKIKGFAKTSGKTGIHIYLPCRGFTFPEARSIAENICAEIHSLTSSFTTTEISVSQRGNRLYLDPNQNDEADTVAAPYSVRPFHQPSVSTPLKWSEIKLGLDPLQFNINTILKRLEKTGDIFSEVLLKKHATANSKILKNLL
ncbi:DNA ligase D [Aridibaculum aurantiacum]|uniref:DNA ligase D n=1 Tax=Aridibaculum aurantiacum TaxID=2810307 RepID=UPI001A96EC31|nr:DNA ligase D [Aridibaculum aurantiacum]